MQTKQLLLFLISTLLHRSREKQDAYAEINSWPPAASTCTATSQAATPTDCKTSKAQA
jgi:hypothetical protein